MPKNHLKFHSVDGKRLILVVDDEMINRELLGAVLSADYEVIFATNGEEALEQVRAHQGTLSLVLLDLLMPVMPGMEVLRRMREDPELRRIPVIVVTSDQNAEIESLNLGAIDFIPKPYPQPGVVLARVQKTIELSEDREIIQVTERDSLTGLYNREFFYRYAVQFDQYHQDMAMDAIIVDVNHFHMINERYGKAYGDEVLRRIGEKVREMVRDSGGIVCRREGDTFMVYCPHREDYTDILNNASIGLAGDDEAENRIRLRMGVYPNADKSIEIERRFDRAKMASDTVRNSFTKTIAYYDNSLHETELYEEQLIEDFQKAIREEQFVVFYQPKFDVRAEIPVLASAEALVRWRHPTLGMISPGVFIPLFEDNGLIQQLDTCVWHKAAAQIKDWKDRLGISVPVSVNVSRIDMYDPALVEKFQSLLSMHGLTANEFLLEITESAYTQDSAQIISTVNRLRDLGFQIEMDDFGTGYSSLNMISSLPIDALKLDMKFIRNAFRDGKDTRLIEVIIDIADYLGVPVIAEGVETEEQLNALKALGCDIVQGYYFSKPVPAEEYEVFVRARRDMAQAPENVLPEAIIASAQSTERTAYTSIAHALTTGFESIYYVDTVGGAYVQFSSQGRYEDLQIERSGTDFFADTQKNIPRVVYKEDRDRVSLSLQKEALLSQLIGGRNFSMTYRLVIGGEILYYNLRAVNAKTRDNHHIVIGVSNVEDQMKQAMGAEEAQERSREFFSIAQALSSDFESIYYVDMETEDYTEFTAQGSYEHLQIELSGSDFFAECQKNLLTVVYEEDQAKVSAALRKQTLRENLAKEQSASLIYRLMINGVPTFYRMKIVKAEDDGEHIVIGVSNIAAQMAREQEYVATQQSSATYSRIAQALSKDYFTIYYVNTETGRFMEYSTAGEERQLRLVQTGENFFEDCKRTIPQRVVPEDRAMAMAAFDRESLLREVADDKTFTITYRMQVDGAPIHAALKALRLPDDPQHIIIGVSNIDDQVQRQQKYDALKAENVTFSSIAQALAADYFSIYYVDTDTDRFVEFSAHDTYLALNIEKGGEDFFNLSRKNILRVVHPEDHEKILAAFTKKNLLAEMDETGTFTLTYRLMFGDKPTFVNMKATRMQAEGDSHIVIGVSNVDAQMKREQELSIARDLANRDALTGVKSKHAYNEMEADINAQIAGGEAKPFAVVVCDVNGLKVVNDTLGHAAGDKLIKDAAMEICNIFVHSPVFRYGGDEFVVLLRGHDYEQRAELMRILADRNREQAGNGGIIIANGVSEYVSGLDGAVSEVFARADARMYENKKQLKGER